MPLLSRRLTAAVLAALVLAGGFQAPARATGTPAAPEAGATGRSARTSAAERRRVDRIPAPKLRWYACYDWAQCATVRLPRDYDHPHGATTEVALLRVKARKPRQRIGNLFVNPGGPGGSATTLALLSPMVLSDTVLDRFDIIGVDPRGVGFSENVRCFTSVRAQTVTLRPMQNLLFPIGAKEQRKYVTAAKKLGKACSGTGRPLSGGMSTAEAARDMDVLRRAVGDRKLTYLGFSYGSFLGEVYANMFPDRIRALAIDGVINPTAWTGTNATRNTVLDDRLRSADGAYRALRDIFRRCDAAGPEYCHAAPNSAAKFAAVARRLKAHPVDLGDVPPFGAMRLTYADFIGGALGSLYSTSAPQDVTVFTWAMWTVISAATGSGAPGDAARLNAAKRAVATQLARTRGGRDFLYANDLEAYSGVLCTDAAHPARAGSWSARAARADKRAPYFGRAWAWASAQCARDTWTVRDEDAYRGPFNRRTGATVLIVGSFHDPATAYAGARQTARKMPNSRLLSSDNWGHTAYGTNPCATQAIDWYLLRRTLPAEGTVCRIPERPFTSPIDDTWLGKAADSRAGGTKEEIAAGGLPAPGRPKQLPPVSTGLPAISAG
jgi:pimeloyl-ACP methyl ester carboxylesterase